MDSFNVGLPVHRSSSPKIDANTLPDRQNYVIALFAIILWIMYVSSDVCQAKPIVHVSESQDKALSLVWGDEQMALAQHIAIYTSLIAILIQITVMHVVTQLLKPASVVRTGDRLRAYLRHLVSVLHFTILMVLFIMFILSSMHIFTHLRKNLYFVVDGVDYAKVYNYRKLAQSSLTEMQARHCLIDHEMLLSRFMFHFVIPIVLWVTLILYAANSIGRMEGASIMFHDDVVAMQGDVIEALPALNARFNSLGDNARSIAPINHDEQVYYGDRPQSDFLMSEYSFAR